MSFGGVAAAPVPARPSMPGKADVDIPAEGIAVLHLADAVMLGLANNRDIRAAYLGRVAQKSVLRAMEDRFSPGFVRDDSHVVGQDPSDRDAQAELSVARQGGTGAFFSLSWNERVTQDEDEVADIVAAPLRQARLNDQINRLNLKAIVSDIVTRIIFTYHEVLRAQEQSRLALEALSRARHAFTSGTYRGAAGYWVESDFSSLVHAEAEVASRELALEEIENRLDASRLRLLQLLGLDGDIQIHAVDALEALPVKVGVARTVAAALKQQPAYLIQRLTAEMAGGNRNSHLIEARKALENDIREGARNLDVRWRQCEAARRSLELARAKLEIERNRMKTTPGGNFRVLVFESDLVNAEFARIDALIGYRNALAALDRISGTTLWSWEIELND